MRPRFPAFLPPVSVSVTLLHRLALALFLLLAPFLLPTTPAAAQSPIATLSGQLSQAEADLHAVDRALDTRLDDDDRDTQRTKALAAQAAATAAASALEDQLKLVDARLGGLGAATANEAPDIRRERANLNRQRAAIDATIKRGRLAGVEAQQLVDEIDRSKAEQFNETISARVASPLSPGFWHAVFTAIPRDMRRVELFLTQGTTQIRAQWRGGFPWQALLGTVLGLALAMPIRLAVQRLGQRHLIDGAPGHRVRRSANALWRVLIGTLAPLLGATFFVQGLRWSGLLPDRWGDLLDALVLAVGFGSFTASVSGAVLMRTQPSWRIAPLDDETATRLRPLSWVLAVLAFLSILATATIRIVGVSAALNVATQAGEALLHLLLIAAFLFAIGRLRADRAARDDAVSQSTSAGLGAATLLAWILVGVALIALLLGYIGFSLIVAQFIAWATVLGSAVYLLLVAVDDIATSVFTRDSRVGIMLTRALGVRGSAVDQFGLLLSGSLRIALVIVALVMLVSPFGAGGGVDTLFGRLGALAKGIQFGGIAISPGTILRGIVALFLGLALVRLFMRWLETRYLPATDLDGSGRNSVSLVARYVGVALAVVWSLASLGIGMERIALLLSALSVGIGFGLQAITSNFVSGLILLAERPIKIGDLIRVGLDEGDVKRISVRSTEIELADHSTLIVPNSELITKSVLNKTLASPLGRIQIQFSVPLGSDAEAVRGIVLDAFTAEEAVLADPAPAVFIDAITDGRILFNAFAHVATPRAAYGARSNVFMMLLARFREQGIDIGTIPQRLELIRPDQPPA